MAIHGKHIPINGQYDTHPPTPCAQPQHVCTLLTRFSLCSPNTRGSNPGTLNTWLRANGGYTQGNDLIESVVPKINPAHISWPPDAMHPTNDIPMTGIRTYLEAGRPVIANVMHVSSRAWSGAPTVIFCLLPALLVAFDAGPSLCAGHWV